MIHFLTQNKSPIFCLILSLASVVLLGCNHTPGSDKPRVGTTITISFAGEPVTDGAVNLENSETGEGGGGELNPDGNAIIPNVVLGSYTVTIVPPDPDPVPPEPGQATPKQQDFKNIPKKFRNSKTSPLKVEIKEGTNEFKFDLKEAG